MTARAWLAEDWPALRELLALGEPVAGIVRDLVEIAAWDGLDFSARALTLALRALIREEAYAALGPGRTSLGCENGRGRDHEERKGRALRRGLPLWWGRGRAVDRSDP